jgi:hypothetical protein
MEPLPRSDSGGGFSETDVGTPLILPVVPLPDEQPVTGALIGSDFKGPVTVPGARRPNPNASASQGAKKDGKSQPSELEPIMEWER